MSWWRCRCLLVMVMAAWCLPAGCGNRPSIPGIFGAGSGGEGWKSDASSAGAGGWSGSGGGAGGGLGGAGAGGGSGGADAGADVGNSSALCRSNADCAPPRFPPASTCLAPGESLLCPGGLACASNADCASQGSPQICDLGPCAPSEGNRCLAGCASDADCASFQTCGFDHRCVGRVCLPGDHTCPANSACDPNNQRCARKACSSDADCAGACVKGSCYDQPGMCAYPPE